MSNKIQRYFIAGGAGFIGGHMTNFLLDNTDASVTVFDNFSTGRRWHFGERIDDPRLTIIEADAQDQERLIEAMPGHDMVYQFAANSDIAAAQRDPAIDFNRR